MAISSLIPNFHHPIILFSMGVSLTELKLEVWKSFVLGSTPAGCQQVMSGPNLSQQCSKSTHSTQSGQGNQATLLSAAQVLIVKKRSVYLEQQESSYFTFESLATQREGHEPAASASPAAF